MRKLGGASLVFAATVGIATCAMVSAAAVGPVYPPTIAYVTGTELTPIDTATNTAGSAIDISGSGIAIAPDGETAYELSNGAMRPIDLATGALGAFIDVGKNPIRVAIAPDGATAYVLHADDTVRAVNLENRTAGPSYPVYDQISDFAVSPDGTALYVADSRISSVIVVDTADLTQRTLVPVGTRTESVAIAPDGATAYFSARNGTIVPVDTATRTAEAPIPVASDELSSIAITPDGATAYVADFRAERVVPVDLAAGTAGAPIPVGGFPGAIAITPDGATAYVVSPNATVVPIDTATNVAGAPIGVSGVTPIDLAITPDQAPMARFRVVPAPSGGATTFDGSKSAGVSGPIVRFHWRFGDGTSSTTTGSITTHVYAAPGSYRATLVVTDAAGTSTQPVFTGRTMSRNGGPSARKTHRVAIT